MEIRYINLDERIPLWTRIQIAYPDEPDWNSLEEEVLVHLVEDFENEQSCATSAILYLASKNPERCAQLATWLANHSNADQWLKAAAHDALDSVADTSDG